VRGRHGARQSWAGSPMTPPRHPDHRGSSAKGSLIEASQTMGRGDVDAALAEAPHRVHGRLEIGAGSLLPRRPDCPRHPRRGWHDPPPPRPSTPARCSISSRICCI
jgi:hypothetical protein